MEESQIQHFLHPEHPLILRSLGESGSSVLCNCCGIKISESGYSCITCNFHLHKLCTNLPNQIIKHPDHDANHPLTLILSEKPFNCSVCHRCVSGSLYRCKCCDFGVDVRCVAEVLQGIDIKGHRHPLRPLLTPAVFECHACAKEHPPGFSYKCNTCVFWIHEDCAILPTVIKYHSHVHHLLLSISDRKVTDIIGDCKICGDHIMGKHHWSYRCTGCHHAVHVHCLTSKLIEERSTNRDEKDFHVDIDKDKWFHLPESCKYDDLMSQLIEHITHDRSKNEAELDQPGIFFHFSHKHPLTLCNVQSNSKPEKRKNCKACLLPVTKPPYYHCSTCSNNNYILHKWCAELPSELQHSIHPHPLSFKEGYTGKYGCHLCSICDVASNGFFYQCLQDECDGFALDIKCLVSPPVLSMSHKIHRHPLKLVKDCLDEGCIACPFQRSEFAYGCEMCCFYLHSSCALQPITIMHRYDKVNSFDLIRAPIEDGPDEYVCELCEKDIDPKWWFYHAIPSDQSACADCIFKKQGPYLDPLVTYFSSVHQHPLKFVQPGSRSKTSLCSLCSNLLDSYHALECALCNTMYHCGKCTPALVQEELG